MTAEHLPADDEQWWLQLIEQQCGVVHRRDIPPEYVRHAVREVRARRWRRIRRDVFVLHNGPLTEDQRRWAALKAAPPGSALSGLTAASIDGLKGFIDETVHITMPCGSRRLNIDGVTEHFSRFLSSSDVHPLRSPTRTRLPRSLLDAASWADTERFARAVILAGVQQAIVSPSQLRDALPSRGPCLRHELITETIDDAEGGIASVPEQEFAGIVRRIGAPEPTRQHVLRHRDGRYYLDADWEAYELSVEVDGRGHMVHTQWEQDLERANEIIINNRRLLRFTSYSVRHRPEIVGATLLRALMSRGWSG
ncbi:hypothetical protein G1H11_12585 [Phytoactinopolyspora alkaliphila]|uniref:DUF559 domain-containing protein n=1 Tax=Phytoactinopolyspora alkaliphila TaxID=1783498 RepID=A0A6N9YM85_9ACTN|nr:hypothetical protein [Phytoactinopolyspora alkaliphila]NED96146.1 hypothetical protein [Phytoactinopolyspora alkaliphila]